MCERMQVACQKRARARETAENADFAAVKLPSKEYLRERPPFQMWKLCAVKKMNDSIRG